VSRTKNYLRQITWIDVLEGFVLGVGLLVLLVSGHPEAAATLWVTAAFHELFNALRRQRARRQRANLAARNATATAASGNGRRTTLPVKESVMLRHSPEVIWSLIHPPETAPLLSPDCQKGYRVPGTPVGLGEQQAFVDLRGNTSVIEVVEIVEFRRAVTKAISADSPIALTSVTSIDPVSGGCIFSVTHEYEMSPRGAYSVAQIAEIRQGIRDYLERVQRALVTWDAGWGSCQNTEGGESA
jgi:hypothetical protein